MFRKLTRVFRKLTLALAAALCLTAGASAQPVLCVVQAAATPSLRDNGTAERIGDLEIICSGGTPTAAGAPAPRFNLQVFTSPGVNITSRVLGGDVSEALLFIDEPVVAAQSICGSVATPADPATPGTCTILGTGNGGGTYSGAPRNGATSGRPNAFIGRRVGENSVVFNGIPFDPPGNGPSRWLRLTNLRINAAQLNNVRGGATAAGLTVSATTGGLANSIQLSIINSPSATVGIVQTPMDFAVSGALFLQCESQNFFGGSLASQVTPQLSLKFSERFAAAFRRRSIAVPVSPDVVPAPGESTNLADYTQFETESGFYKIPNGSSWNLDQLGLAAPASLDKAGLADTGTRLLARFKNVPAGVMLYAANHGQLIQVNNPNFPVTGNVHATVANATGDGAFSSAGPTGALSPIFPLSGTATFAWEVIDTTTTVTEAVTLPIAVAYLSADGSRPRSGDVGADGQLAPLSSSATASATAPIPRFVEDAGNNNRQLFTISPGPCAPPGGAMTLTVSVNPPGAGAILSSTQGTCGSVCSSIYGPAFPPTLVALPFAGFAFTGWSGACSGAGNCTPFLDGTPATANFARNSRGTMSLGVKSGPSNARIWPLTLAEANDGVAYDFHLDQTAGAACTPILGQQSLGFFPETFSPPPTLTQLLTIDFTGCPANARFRFRLKYVTENSQVFQTVLWNNQFQ